MTALRHEHWVLLGFALLVSVLLIAWRVAIGLQRSAPMASKPVANQQATEQKTDVEMAQGQLVVEIPERQERWDLHFRYSEYNPETKEAVVHDSVCQVRQKGQVVTVFQAPRVIVRFAKHELVMQGGVTVVALLPRLRVNLPTVRWNWQTGTLVGTGPVHVEGERVSSTADALEGDTTLQQLVLRGHVSVDWRSKTP